MACGDPILLSGTIAVDHSQPDRFLEATRARYAVLAPGRLFLHADQAEAVSRCMASQGEVNIVGHGEPGMIGTGCGDLPTLAQLAERIAVSNIGAWAASGMTKLTLFGCNTGEGRAGAQLLFEIAKATGITVRAPTVFVYIGEGCEDLNLELNAERPWQTATPDGLPEPIFDSAPKEFAPQTLALVTDGMPSFLEIPSVDSILLHKPGPIDPDTPPIRRWDGADTIACLRRIDFDNPLRRGAPAAIETGRLEVIYRSGPVEQRRTFRIFNDRMLQDLTELTVFYRANISALRSDLV